MSSTPPIASKISTSKCPINYQGNPQGQNLYFLDQDEDALSVLTEALKERPQVAKIHDYRARALEALNRPEEALAEQVQAIELDDLDPDNLRRYAWRLTRQNRIKEAEIILTKALTYGSHDHAVLGNFGRLYLADLNNPAKALSYLKKAVRLKPEKPRYRLHYGWALSRLEDCKAVAILQQYQLRCMVSNDCSSHDLEWTKKTSQRMIWKEGCWREHPTLKLLKRFVKWLPRL